MRRRRSSCSATGCGGGDTAAIQPILGRSIRINDVPHTVVGVMPPGASLPGPLAGDDAVWLPMRMTAAERDGATSHNYTVVARLADGVSFERASAELRRSPRGWRRNIRSPIARSARGWCRWRADGPRDQAGAPRHRRRRGAAAPGGVRECGDAAHRAGGEPPSRDRGPRRARRLPPAPLVAGGCRMPGVLDARRRVRADVGRWALRGLLPLFAASLPPSALRRRRRTGGAVHARW